MKKCQIGDCTKSAVAKGMCPMHYRRNSKYGDPNVVKVKQSHGLTLMERFMEYVEPMSNMKSPTSCREWIGYRDPNGYGRLNINNVPVPAHRLAWKLFNGPLRKMDHVLHRCDNPACVRPDHLFLGDQSTNAHDMWDKGRGRPGKSVGEKHGCAKLAESDVLEIRSSMHTASALADKFDVSRTTIYDIINRRIWKHI